MISLCIFISVYFGSIVLDKTKKTKKLKIFDFQKDGKGISKSSADLGYGLKKFFVSYKDNFGKLVSVNMFMILGNFPLIFIIATLAGVTKNDVFLPLSDLFQNVNGFFMADGALSPFKLSIFALEGLQNQTYAATALTYVFYGIGALTLLTFGIVNVGTAYILRNIASGEPVFVWQDFWYAVKRNWKQALPLGAIDAFICALLTFNIYTTITGTSVFITSVMFWSNVIIAVLYFYMRYYFYIQMVTFKLSIFKIIKNSMIFALLGIKRNTVALLGVFAVIILELLLLFGTGGILVPVAVAAPLAILFSSFAYMKVYAAYYKIKVIMIDPYKAAHPDEFPEPDSDDAIMRDDVTANERLARIKENNNIN